MITSTPSKSKKAWAAAIAEPAKEFSLTPLPNTSGNIPKGLRGTLYRNGPGRLERGGVQMGHWFDGDGAILGVHFTDRGASAVYHYVQTTGYKEETAANKLLYGNYGMTAPGGFWEKVSKSTKHVANTSVLALPDKVLALWEGGKPYALSLQHLETRGEDDLGGLQDGWTFSAHCKCDPQTGEIFNFGVEVGASPTLHIYKSTASGRIVQTAAHRLGSISMLHDFVFAGQYLVFFIPPVRLNIFPALLGLSSFSEALKWQPSKGTQILVIDRKTLKLISRSVAEPWFQWHFANGFVDESGTIIVDVVAYKDFQTNQYLKEVATGETKTSAVSALWRIYLNPQTGKVIKKEEVLDKHCEFPVVPQRRVGQYSPYTFLNVHRPCLSATSESTQELFGAIARVDNQNCSVTIADCGENRYPSEPIYAPDTENPEKGWVITVVYDGNSHGSEVWVFDADRLNEEAVCKLELPGVVPHGFHGTWKS
ncbi:MAG: carotenoid oxygenase family protein [Scytonematopsis contorta HA4267-MV1]|jgi:carotenoid cleavage dioxygenase-like enzyme|nr:carotenoid oxygenase family protein [Scytonematopsis contorta HA4267-MV1]